MKTFRTGIMGLTLILASCAPQTKAPPFEPALAKHFEAIKTRDLPAYLATITKGENLPLIFPDGTFMGTRSEVEAFHREWFSMPDWRMEFEPVSQIVGSDMANVLVKTSYRDTPEGEPRFAYLALTFQVQDGEWRLVQDQNTRITKPKPAKKGQRQ